MGSKITNKDLEQYYNLELGWLRNSKTEDELNKQWKETLLNLGLYRDLAFDKSIPSYERAEYLGYYNLGRDYLKNVYETRMGELQGTAYPEDWMNPTEKAKHAAGYDDYVAFEKNSQEARKYREEVQSLNEQAAAIATRKQQQEEVSPNRNPMIPGRDSSQTMLTGRDRGKQTMLTRGYQRRTLMGG